MALKWDPLKIHNGLDQLEALVQNLRPGLAPIVEKAQKLKETKDLPGYMEQYLTGLGLELKNIQERLFREIDSARNAIPAVERPPATKRKFTLLPGRQYEIRQGGAHLHWKEEIRYSESYSHWRPHELSLHVGDIITYVGRNPGANYFEDYRGEAKLDMLDVFQFGETKGVFLPVNGDNRAARRFFRPVK